LAEVIVALDFDSREPALRLVDALAEEAEFYKVGLELFTRAGPDVVAELTARDKSVFLDLKLHDIPNTVAGAVRAASAGGVRLLTVHAWGGPEMLAAAAGAADADLEILAVTVLTSLSGYTLGQVLGRPGADPLAEVERMARMAQAAGVDGAVCSPHEAAAVRAAAGPGFTIVTPGIRLAGGSRHDQARVATPAAAAEAGADYLVVGRAVTQAADPVAALRQVRAESAMGRRTAETAP
jgi:orotidine-5'-phosphate decarboxylase